MDLTKRAPRSPRVRLGGYAILPRMLDKCRADIAGKIGEYHYNCPTDQHFLTFAGIDPEAFKAQVAKGGGDGEILEWVRVNAKNKPTPMQIEAWSNYVQTRTPSDLEMREWFQDVHKKIGPNRDDIVTYFDLLDLDDYVSFGGKA